jgi:hypothetical protein
VLGSAGIVLLAVALSVRGSQVLVGTSEAQVESLLGSPVVPDANVVKDAGVLVAALVVVVALVVLVLVVVLVVVVALVVLVLVVVLVGVVLVLVGVVLVLVGVVVVLVGVVLVGLVVVAVVDVAEPWHELPGHGLALAEAPGVTRTAVAPARLSIVKNEKMAASLDKAALQVEWKVVPCHRRPITHWHPLIGALKSGLCALECLERVSGATRSGMALPAFARLNAPATAITVCTGSADRRCAR